MRSFKEKLRVDETSNIEQAVNEETKDFLSLTKMHFEGQSNEETKVRSKHFKDILRLRQDWSPLSHLTPKISDNYGNYTHYTKTFPTMKDKLSNVQDSKLNIKEFMKHVDPRSQERIEAMKRKNPFEFLSKLDSEQRKLEIKHEKTQKARKEMFPGSTIHPPLASEFIKRPTRKKTLNRNLIEKDPKALNGDQEISDSELPKGFKRKGKPVDLEDQEFNLESLENEKAAAGEESKGRAGGLMGEDDFADLLPERKIQKKDEVKLGGLNKQNSTKANPEKGFTSTYNLEYQTLINRLHWDKDAIDEENEEEDPVKVRQDRGPFTKKRYGNILNRKIRGRVSPWAKEEILRLYLDGWCVRDISLRYGILPERVKAIIWMRKTFYDEVFPRIDIKTVKLGMERELFYGEDWPWVDFGLDMDKMIQKERGVPVMDFQNPNKPIDTKAEEDVERRMQKFLETKQKKKQDRVTEGFIGSGNKAYFLKSWLVYKGHGSERVTRAFKNVVHYSERRERLCKNVLEKVKQGPRYASMGYGIK